MGFLIGFLWVTTSLIAYGIGFKVGGNYVINEMQKIMDAKFPKKEKDV